jgi:DNA polymerase/3'-5' exonuclease PolX
MELIKAKKIATAICYQLLPYCSKINIAGSIRRKKPEVKDIEIICVPKKILAQFENLFERTEISIVDPEFAKTVLSLGQVIKGVPQGKYMQLELPEGIKLDLFIPADFDYYRQFAIRTGSADYSAKIIAAGWKRIGWCGADIGLRLIKDCTEHKGPDGKTKYKCERAKNNRPPVWQSEEEFFKWIKVPFIQPEFRNV